MKDYGYGYEGRKLNSICLPPCSGIPLRFHGHDSPQGPYHPGEMIFHSHSANLDIMNQIIQFDYNL